MWSSRIKLFRRYLDMVSLSHHSPQARIGSHPRVICFNMSRYTKSHPFNRPFTIQLLWATARLLVPRFIVLSTQWMKEMRKWVWSEITSHCFLFGVNQVHCFGSKTTELRGRSKCQQGDTSWVWYYVLIVLGWRLIPYIHGLMNNATELNRRRPSPIPWRAEHHSVNSSEDMKFLLKTNNGRGERPSWAILSATYALAKTWQCKGHISSHCLYGQALCTYYGTLLLLLLLLVLFT